MPKIFRSCMIAILLLSFGSGLHGSDTEKDVEKQLKLLYEGETFIIRHFYIGNHLKYDAEGTLTSEAESGPWTLYGLYEIENLAIKKKKIELKGKRFYWGYNSGVWGIQYFRSPDRTRIEIERSGSPLNVHSVPKVLDKVFLPNFESLYKEVPRYWKKFVMNTYNGGEIDLLKIENKCPDGSFYDRQVICRDVHLPSYPEIYRKFRIRGKLQLRVTTDKEGNVTIEDIISPLGCGLDEEAIESLSEWTVSPARCGDQPVEGEGIAEFFF